MHQGHDSESHGHHHHDLSIGVRNSRLLFISLALILVTMAAEIVVGVMANSLALLADAGHMLTNAVALGLAVAAAGVAAKPPRGRWTYGFGRVEILAAQLNGVILGLLGIWIVYEAVKRLIDPLEVNATLVGWVALVGLVVSVLIIALLSRAHRERVSTSEPHTSMLFR